MSEVEKQKKISLTLLTLFIFSILIIGVLISSSNMINDLSKSTISNLSEYVINSNFALEEENINEILSQYEEERAEIEKKTVNNGITSLLITLLIILTSIKKIIKTSKSIIKDIINGKDKENVTDSNKQRADMNIDELLSKISEYKRLKEIIDELDMNNEKDRQQDERIMRVEGMMINILEDFVGTLGKTSKYANQINLNKEQLQAGIDEIKKGMEQISRVVKYKKLNESDMTREEFMAAVQQIYTTLEEAGTLIEDMDKKVKALSDHIENYKNVKENSRG